MANDDLRSHSGLESVRPGVADAALADAASGTDGLSARLIECQSPTALLRNSPATSHVADALEEPTVNQHPGERARPEVLTGLEPIVEDAPRIPGHRSVRKLGEGTYGKVWLYEEDRTGVRVAVKFFDHCASQQWQMLQDEVKQLARLHGDPGIVELKDVEPNAIPPYYVMRYAEQGSLAHRLEQGPLPVAEALLIFRQAAEALAYVHAKGIRHCDLKPGNVLLDSRGRVLLGDFGQAHLCSDLRPALGTYFYMAPEQADLAHSIPDTRWDVYGLGALMYAMVTGVPPREAAHIRDELARTVELPSRLQRYRDWVRQAPAPTAHHHAAGMDRRLALIIDRCLAIDPNARFHDAAAVLDALNRRGAARRRRPLLVFGLFAPLLLLVLMGLNAFLLAHEAMTQSELALTNQLKTSNLAMARLTANVIEEKLRERVEFLTKQTQDSELTAAIANGTPRGRLHEVLLKHKQLDTDQFFTKWMLVDRQGHILADEPQQPELWDQKQRWCWRDWFNGTGDKPSRQAEWLEPINRTHISVPYLPTRAAERGRRDPLMISISTPVRDPAEPAKVVGLLVGSMYVSDLYAWLDGVEAQASAGFPVVLNDHRQCVLHRDRELVRQRFLQQSQAISEPFEGQLYENVLKRGIAGSIDDHEDAIDGRIYIASYAPVPSFGWGVAVQLERSTALKPIDDLRGWMRTFGLAALIGLIVLTTGLWAWLIWALRQEERTGMVA